MLAGLMPSPMSQQASAVGRGVICITAQLHHHPDLTCLLINHQHLLSTDTDPNKAGP